MIDLLVAGGGPAGLATALYGARAGLEVAVVERGDHFYCIVAQDGQFAAREVSVGHANEQVVVINDGVQPGDHVVLAPQNYESNVDFEAASARLASTTAATANTPTMA